MDPPLFGSSPQEMLAVPLCGPMCANVEQQEVSSAKTSQHEEFSKAKDEASYVHPRTLNAKGLPSQKREKLKLGNIITTTECADVHNRHLARFPFLPSKRKPPLRWKKPSPFGVRVDYPVNPLLQPVLQDTNPFLDSRPTYRGSTRLYEVHIQGLAAPPRIHGHAHICDNSNSSSPINTQAIGHAETCMCKSADAHISNDQNISNRVFMQSDSDAPLPANPSNSMNSNNSINQINTSRHINTINGINSNNMYSSAACTSSIADRGVNAHTHAHSYIHGHSCTSSVKISQTASREYTDQRESASPLPSSIWAKNGHAHTDNSGNSVHAMEWINGEVDNQLMFALPRVCANHSSRISEPICLPYTSAEVVELGLVERSGELPLVQEVSQCGGTVMGGCMNTYEPVVPFHSVLQNGEQFQLGINSPVPLNSDILAKNECPHRSHVPGVKGFEPLHSSNTHPRCLNQANLSMTDSTIHGECSMDHNVGFASDPSAQSSHSLVVEEHSHSTEHEIDMRGMHHLNTQNAINSFDQGNPPNEYNPINSQKHHSSQNPQNAKSAQPSLNTQNVLPNNSPLCMHNESSALFHWITKPQALGISCSTSDLLSEADGDLRVPLQNIVVSLSPHPTNFYAAIRTSEIADFSDVSRPPGSMAEKHTRDFESLSSLSHRHPHTNIYPENADTTTLMHTPIHPPICAQIPTHTETSSTTTTSTPTYSLTGTYAHNEDSCNDTHPRPPLEGSISRHAYAANQKINAYGPACGELLRQPDALSEGVCAAQGMPEEVAKGTKEVQVTFSGILKGQEGIVSDPVTQICAFRDNQQKHGSLVQEDAPKARPERQLDMMACDNGSESGTESIPNISVVNANKDMKTCSACPGVSHIQAASNKNQFLYTKTDILLARPRSRVPFSPYNAGPNLLNDSLFGIWKFAIVRQSPFNQQKLQGSTRGGQPLSARASASPKHFMLRKKEKQMLTLRTQLPLTRRQSAPGGTEDMVETNTRRGKVEARDARTLHAIKAPQVYQDQTHATSAQTSLHCLRDSENPIASAPVADVTSLSNGIFSKRCLITTKPASNAIVGPPLKAHAVTKTSQPIVNGALVSCSIKQGRNGEDYIFHNMQVDMGGKEDSKLFPALHLVGPEQLKNGDDIRPWPEKAEGFNRRISSAYDEFLRATNIVEGLAAQAAANAAHAQST